MRPTAYTSFIEGALFAMGMYISHKDKDYKNIKNDIHEIAS